MKIMIATPVADGSCRIEYMTSILMVCKVLTVQGVDWDYITLSGDQFIGRARDRLVHSFLSSDYTDLVFVDSDIAFKPHELIKLLNHDVDVVCGNYRKKGVIDSTFVCDVEDTTIHSNGLVKARMVATGFLKLRRSVFAREVPEYLFEGTGMIKQFFPFGPQDGRFVGEDVSFCRQHKGDLWIDPSIKLDHIGTKAYTGEYLDQLTTKE